ncbi:lipopolysaccharide core heptosyltransferase RfaQ [Citrobacter sp. Cpo090]|uniref:lipopolysaccharide core heptosyltransferase RfaQ n=1 Tax=Citrobacter sp. Cpo090 TaxID=2985139 RepID=UPI0025778248|nr:lipopolysaccharide core heptosyltransferase RfaQ [Citrobacter sp. Cpo090]MDM2844649.1 lipopolysaccharide core heptosyltransferase RfaQ [Citrobacter sp. Cpo090]
MEKLFRNILVIKMRFHGDMLLTTPVISTLKRNYPDAKIDVLLYEDTKPILSENPEINALYGISKKNTTTKNKIANFISLIKKLRQNQYDLVINLTDQWLVALLVRFLSADTKLSPDFLHRQKPFWQKSFTHLVPITGDHIVERNLSILNPLGLKTLNHELSMHYAPSHWKNIHKQLKQLNVGERYVVIQPTARQIFKCWDNEKFCEVIDALQEQGYPVVLTSGPGKEDQECIHDIAEGCKLSPVTALAGKTTFPELAALIDHAALFIGVDSAPMHISAAVKTPIICLFGATDHIAWRPWAENVTLLWAGNYQPVPPRERLDRSYKYPSVIPAEDVINAAWQVLNGAAPEVEVNAQ